MNVLENRLKAACLTGQVTYGVWLSSGSPILAELAGTTGFDWCLIDGEHGPNTLSEITAQLQALAISGTSAVVRVAAAESWLIKQVVDELRQELPQLDTFVTLSPIPTLNRWLATQEDAVDILAGTATPEQLQAQAAKYLLEAKTSRGLPMDPVARFHLGNGAQIYAVHPEADLSDKGRKQSSGAMVNYHYDLDLIEQNHERFVQQGEVSTAPNFRIGTSQSKTLQQRMGIS